MKMIIIIICEIFLLGDDFIMKKFIYLIALVISTSAIFGQDEELEVKGNVLYKDQVNSLKPPVPVLDVPQSVSVITDMTSNYKVSDKLVILLDIRLA